MLSNFQKLVTRWQRTAVFCRRESKSWLRELHWLPASKSCQRLQSPAAHGIHLTGGWHASMHSAQRANCPDFITKDQWPPNSPDLNQMDCHVWVAMLEAYHKLKTQLKTIAELKGALQVIWGNLPHGPIDKAVKDFSKGLERLCWSWRWTLRTFTVTMQNSCIWSLVNCFI